MSRKNKGGKASEHRKQKKLEKKKRNKAKRSAGQVSAEASASNFRQRTMSRIESVFGDEYSSEIFQLALGGASAAEIAEKLELDEERVSEIVDDFSRMDPNILALLEGAPGVLSKGAQFRQMLSNEMKAKQARPW